MAPGERGGRVPAAAGSLTPRGEASGGDLRRWGGGTPVATFAPFAEGFAAKEAEDDRCDRCGSQPHARGNARVVDRASSIGSRRSSRVRGQCARHGLAPVRLVATRKAEQNEAVADPWTVVHFSAGLALGLMNVPFRWALAASIAYEIAEQVLERREFGKDLFETAGPESAPNAILDTLTFVAGHRLGRQWNRTR